jgi:hypothetical protein
MPVTATCTRAYRGPDGYKTCELPRDHAGPHGPATFQMKLPERCTYVHPRTGRCIVRGSHTRHLSPVGGLERLETLIEHQREYHVRHHTSRQLESCADPQCQFYGDKARDPRPPYSYVEYLELPSTSRTV